MKGAQADVYRRQERAGILRRTRAGSIFEYDDTFLSKVQPGGRGIGFNLPYSTKRIETRGVNLHTFFAGLLPEGIRLRALVRRVKTSEDDLMSLLVAAGADCVGDVSVVPSGEKPEDATPAIDWRHADRASFAEVLIESLKSPREATIPGVQEKVSASLISLPVRAGRGTAHILKLNPKDKPKLVENEHFMMNMAKACGLVVATTRLLRDREGQTGLLVERFDRVGGKKLHQEDACQLLDRYPADKYLLSSADLMRALDVCTAPIVERAKLLRLIALSYWIANGDLHGKNVSVRVFDGRVELTPAYDLLTTLPYGDTHMALKLDARDDNLRRGDFVRFGERFGVRPGATEAILDSLVELGTPYLERLDEIGFEPKRTRHLERTMRKRLADLAGSS
jgi:serine/threonine-protein kinase HipA